MVVWLYGSMAVLGIIKYFVCMIVWQYGCMAVLGMMKESVCMVVWPYGCMAYKGWIYKSELYGCMAVWLYGSLKQAKNKNVRTFKFGLLKNGWLRFTLSIETIKSETSESDCSISKILPKYLKKVWILLNITLFKRSNSDFFIIYFLKIKKK